MTPVGVFFTAFLPLGVNEQALCQQPQTVLKYTVRRFFEMLLTIFVIATATFFLLAAVPGDPLSDRADRLPESIRENLYRKYGLAKSSSNSIYFTVNNNKQARKTYLLFR